MNVKKYPSQESLSNALADISSIFPIHMDTNTSFTHCNQGLVEKNPAVLVPVFSGLAPETPPNCRPATFEELIAFSEECEFESDEDSEESPGSRLIKDTAGIILATGTKLYKLGENIEGLFPSFIPFFYPKRSWKFWGRGYSPKFERSFSLLQNSGRLNILQLIESLTDPRTLKHPTWFKDDSGIDSIPRVLYIKT